VLFNHRIHHVDPGVISKDSDALKNIIGIISGEAEAETICLALLSKP